VCSFLFRSLLPDPNPSARLHILASLFFEYLAVAFFFSLFYSFLKLVSRPLFPGPPDPSCLKFPFLLCFMLFSAAYACFFGFFFICIFLDSLVFLVFFFFFFFPYFLSHRLVFVSTFFPFWFLYYPALFL